MKNIFKTSAFALAAAALFSACSNDEPAMDNGGNTSDDARTAYIQVNVRPSNALGSRGTDGGYENGNANEHDINNAKFYFFDQGGLFMLEASVWNGGNPTNNGNGNIEYIGKNVLVLEGLKPGEDFPAYMLTVLNVPAGFTPGNNIADTRSKIVGITDNNRFVMSTSSFGEEGNNQYGVTKLSADNFQVQAPGTDIPSTFETVDVYVERLAAKVQVNLNATPDKEINGVKYYKINASVAGNPNNEGSANEGVTELYAGLTAWDINATAPNSYLSKDISGFTANAPFDGWNNANDHRSFWGKSVVYGQSSPALNYKSAAAATVAFGNSAYCAENTNTADAISKADAANLLIDRNVTSVIFTANVVAIDSENNVTYPDLVRFNGVLYQKDQFFAYALNNLNIQGKLNYWKSVGDGYQQLDATDLALMLQSSGTGTGMVNIASELTSGNFFTKEGDAFVASTWNDETLGALNDDLAKFYNNTESTANAYTGGAMFYSVPIEHLVNRASTTDDIAEGNYGVVRNHWYQINVNKVTTLGHGIFDPADEQLIPDDPKDPSYFLGATINVLSWKVVSQNVGI